MKYITLLTIPLLASSVSASLMVDTFNDSLTSITTSGDGETSAVDLDDTTSALGGSREVRVHNTSTDGLSTQNNAITDGNTFVWSQETNSIGHFHISYGSRIASPDTFNLDADFNDSTSVVLTVIASDIAGLVEFTFDMNVGEADESVWSASKLLTQTGGEFGNPSPFNLVFDFSDFTMVSEVNTGQGVFDTTDVDGILVEVASELKSADWQFDQIEGINQIPEPSSTALLGLGGLALILRRRR